MRFIIILLLLAMSLCGRAQQKVIIQVINKEKNPVAATISIKGNPKALTTDSTGLTSFYFPARGAFIVVVSAVGHEEKESTVSIPYPSDTLLITMEESQSKMDEIIIQSTRTSRTIANVPTRVETIELEEIDEKSNMRPSNVAMLLHESTGIQVQQTSATSGNASIRMQGLDGRYTQLLKDGFANFGAFSSGLSILEIPPLDLKQVEIIKGPASTLFGGGAIAGVVNFISKTPAQKPEYSFILNQSNIGQTNIGGFTSARNKTIGYTLMALYNRQKAYDVDGDEFTEIPKSDEVTIHPKLFFYLPKNLTLSIGNSLTSAKRTGGDITVIKGKADNGHQYFERNETLRNISTFELDKKMDERSLLVVKQSFSLFDRKIEIPLYVFAGKDYTAFTDLSYARNSNKQSLVIGGNFTYNNFRETTGGGRDIRTQTGGLYAQHTWDASEKIKLESGMRVDVVEVKTAAGARTEAFALPRVSLLIRYNSQWSSRIGGGLGYKAYTPFTEQTETAQYRNVLLSENVRSEKSYGSTADVNFRTTIGSELGFTMNQMFFYTRIQRPLVLRTNGTGGLYFANAPEALRSLGFETNVRFIYKEDFKLFLGYTFTHAKAGYLQGNETLPLVPQSKLNTALIYEKDGVIKLGLEGYFTGRQYLSNGERRPAFQEYGFMAEKPFKHWSLFVNFENFTDTRQGRYKTVVSGSHTDPVFDEIWTHTEGFVVNGGIKLKW